MILSTLLRRYANSRVDLSDLSVEQIAVAVRQFGLFLQRVPGLSDLSKSNLIAFMRARRQTGRSAATVNRQCGHLMTLWRFAADESLAPEPPRKLPRADREDRMPTAWRVEQIETILAACDKAPDYDRWGPAHWKALVLSIYDTSLRVGSLMKADRQCFDPIARTLTLPAAIQKGKAETSQEVSQQTTDALLALDAVRPAWTQKLFAWPWYLGSSSVQRRYRTEVLIPAGLPCSRRDLFHRIRRTSYTLVARELGLEAAGRHAAHRGDLSRHYLDRSMLAGSSAVAVLPRPCGDRAATQSDVRRLSIDSICRRLNAVPVEQLPAIERIVGAFA